MYYADAELLGVTKNNLNAFAIYPNPTNGNVHFKSNQPIEKVQVFSITGSLLQSEQNVNSLSLDAFSAGIYLIKLTTATQTQTYKIIKN